MKTLLSILTLSLLLFLYSFAYANQLANDPRMSLSFRFAQTLESEDIASIEAFIRAGTDVNSPEIVTYLGKTPLHHAVFVENIPMTYILLEANASVHALNNAWRTPLFGVAFNGNETIACMLLAKGARLDHLDYFGRKASFWAKQSGHEGVANTLETAENTNTNVNINGEQRTNITDLDDCFRPK